MLGCKDLLVSFMGNFVPQKLGSMSLQGVMNGAVIVYVLITCLILLHYYVLCICCGSYLITGLDCWTGLMDWITALNLFISHDLHPIKCLSYSKRTSSSHCMLGNIHECTVHKLHGRMCIMNSWCTSSELKASSDYSKCAKEHQKY